MRYHSHLGKWKLIIPALLTTLLAWQSCTKDPDTSPVIKNTQDTVPISSDWPEQVYKFENNHLTEAGFQLGKRLFFDPRLSRNNMISCASCHRPEAAFADPNRAVSLGVEGRRGIRNSQPLFNLVWNSLFLWDGGVNHLESQPIVPIQHPLEMDERLENVIRKISADRGYRDQFAAAFGDTAVNSQRIFRALAQFMGSLVSNDTKYDRYIQEIPGNEFSDQELKGLKVFRNNCASCHKEPLFTDNSFRNNGLRPTQLNDSGRAHITLRSEDLYTFRVPSLRNLRFTAPYMHDGRFRTLNEVLDHYASGIDAGSANLDRSLRNGIQLSDEDRAALLAFLETLNDFSFIGNSRFRP